MFRELLKIELALSNIRLSRRRHSTIWGGASLLTTLMDAMSDLVQSSWDWDFVINLSESDFPIKLVFSHFIVRVSNLVFFQIYKMVIEIIHF